EQERELRAYLQAKGTRTPKEELNPEQLAEERLLMGLRTREGIALEELNRRYQYQLNDRQRSYLNRRQKEEKLVFNDRIALTDKGIKIDDAIILDLVTMH